MTRALGIDIGNSHIKIAEIEVGSKNRELIGLYEIARDPKIDAGTQLREFLSTTGIHADRYILGLGAAPIYMRRASFPFGDRKRVASAIQGEIEDSVPFPIESYILDYRETSKLGRVHNFLIGLCPANWAEQLNVIVEKANIVPWAFQVDSEAIGQMAMHQQLPAAFEGSLYAVVDLGLESTKLALVRGFMPDPQDRKAKAPSVPGEVVDFRTINKGSAELINWIKTERKVSFEDAVQWLVHRAVIKNDNRGSDEKAKISDGLSDEMKIALRPIVVELYQSFQAYRGRSGDMPSAIYLTGALSDIKGLRDFIGEELRLAVHPWPIFLGFNSDKVPLTTEKERSFAVALSLAYRAVVRKPRGWLNFRRSPQAARKVLSNALAELMSAEYKPLIQGACFFFAAVFVYCLVTRYFVSVQLEDSKQEMISELRTLSPDAARIVAKSSDDVLFKAKSAFEAEKKRKAQVDKPKGRDPVEKARGDILVDISSALPAKALLQKIKIEKGAGSIVVTGEIQSSDAAAGPAATDPLKKSFESALTQRGYEKPVLKAEGAALTFTATWKGRSS